MPLVDLPTYELSPYLRNGHINTLYTYLKRKPRVEGVERIRYTTYDDDFIDVDHLKQGNNRVVLLLHGLEGSSSSQYMGGMANFLRGHQFDVAMINHRSCSGHLNKTMTMYHSGFTQDVDLLAQLLSKEYEELYIVGFSMGGNMALKYIGDGAYSLPSNLKKVAAISVPIELSSSSNKLTHWSNYLYERNFLGTLKKKAYLKQQQFPNEISVGQIANIKSLVDFDDHFTGPIHGFVNAEDYYTQSSAKQFLPSIKVPGLLINALDDPFLTPECFPFEIAKASKLFHFGAVKHGGHVGFYDRNYPGSYVEPIVLDWLQRL